MKKTKKVLLFIICLLIVTSITIVYAKNNFDNEFVGDNICTQPGTIASLRAVGWLLMIAKMLIPIIIIVFGSLDVYKVVLRGESKEIYAALKSLGARMVLGIFIFFLPTLVRAVVGYLLPAEYMTCAKCMLKPSECSEGNILDVNKTNNNSNDNNNNSNDNKNNAINNNKK